MPEEVMDKAMDVDMAADVDPVVIQDMGEEEDPDVTQDMGEEEDMEEEEVVTELLTRITKPFTLRNTRLCFRFAFTYYIIPFFDTQLVGDQFAFCHQQKIDILMPDIQ